MSGLKKASANWAISSSASVGGKLGVGLSGLILTLFDVDNQDFYDCVLGGPAIGLSTPLSLTISTFSPTFFTVSKPMFASDFHGRFCGYVDFSFVTGVGYSITGFTIHRVNHNPPGLDLSGIAVGGGGGVTLSPVMWMSVSTNPTPNQGCIIAPTPDRLCGGFSKPEPRETTDTNRSRAR